MDVNHPLYARYQKIFLTQLEVIEKTIEDLRDDFSIKTLEVLRKDLNKLTRDGTNFEGGEIGALCFRLECEVVEKITNFYHLNVSDTWYDEMKTTINKIKNSIQNKPHTSGNNG